MQEIRVHVTIEGHPSYKDKSIAPAPGPDNYTSLASQTVRQVNYEREIEIYEAILFNRYS
jgi:hypothetical protein